MWWLRQNSDVFIALWAWAPSGDSTFFDCNENHVTLRTFVHIKTAFISTPFSTNDRGVRLVRELRIETTDWGRVQAADDGPISFFGFHEARKQTVILTVHTLLQLTISHQQLIEAAFAFHRLSNSRLFWEVFLLQPGTFRRFSTENDMCYMLSHVIAQMYIP